MSNLDKSPQKATLGAPLKALGLSALRYSHWACRGKTTRLFKYYVTGQTSFCHLGGVKNSLQSTQTYLYKQKKIIKSVKLNFILERRLERRYSIDLLIKNRTYT